MVENEIHFLSWRQFQQMAPSILGLELTRLSRLLEEEAPSPEERNFIVQARYELERFIACVEKAQGGRLEDCSLRLQSALLHTAMAQEILGHPTLAYVLDRIRYVQGRIPYIH